MSTLKDRFAFYRFKKRWRKRNYSYGIIDFHAITNNRLYIGNFCSIAENVTFLAGLDHPTNLVSTYPFKSYFMMALMRFLK